MRKGDLSAKTSLSEYQHEENLYALGAIENLKGEILIFNSQPYHSYVENGEMKFDTTYSKSATLFVKANVKEWISIDIPNSVITKDDLETHLEKAATENNIDINQPFPFIIEGTPASMDWHVINWKDGDTEHSHEKHITSGLYGTLNNEKATILGFYSNAHHAIFTHHTTNMHIHMRLDNGHIAGHVDELVLGEGMVLRLPRNAVFDSAQAADTVH